MRTINHSNYEEWLFEYFEGNLSKEEKNEIMNFIQKDPVLEEEFNNWGKTYIRESLPSKLEIEADLLKEDSTRSYKKYGVIAAIMLFGVSAYFMYDLQTVPIKQQIFSNEKHAIVTDDKFIAKEINKENSSKELLKTIIETPKENNLEIPLKLSIINESEKVQDSVSYETISDRASENIIAYSKIDSVRVNHEEHISTVDNSNKASSKEQRKLQRRIERYKRRAKEKREADKYLKGNTPYVIPVDPQAF